LTRTPESARPDPAWEAFAAREPYFAVLSAPRFRRDRLTPEAEREFFATGERLVEWMFGVIDGVFPLFAPASTLEYGCGPGRLALPLARRPGSVTAVDHSPAMLALARDNAERHGLGHVEFQTPDALFSGTRIFDLVVCYHVLQRMPRAAAAALVERLIDRIGPGGIGVFQWPLRARPTSPAVRLSRWARAHVPGANDLANRLLRKPADEPFVTTHTYDLAEIVPRFDLGRFRTAHVVLERDEGLDYAVVVAQRLDTNGSRQPGVAPNPRAQVAASAPDASDAEIEGFNRAAEAYYASLTGWDHLLAKPFSNTEETPTLLASAAVVLQALDLTPGLRVVEFGCGPGWLSEWLSQMGCEAVLLDVSSTALKIAEERYRRQPGMETLPAPMFLLFDGRHIELPDASADRVVCFDAFHHAPNPDHVIREFGRILKPGGIAAFAEPGPRHADAPRSRFEAGTYGVVERDVDVHAVWRTARAAGFADLRMCVFHGPPHHVSLQAYEDLLAGGAEGERWVRATRKFLRYVRNFYLVKAGDVARDSRTSRGLACEIRPAAPRIDAAAGAPIAIDATVTNCGTADWLPSGSGRGAVSLGTHLYDEAGRLVSFDHVCHPLTDPPRTVRPGETVRCLLVVPALGAGRYRIELDCVASDVTWFAQAGSSPAMIVVEVARG
jgi:SAM-dependent methyltransferase